MVRRALTKSLAIAALSLTLVAGSAWAAYPLRSQMDRVEVIANELQNISQRLERRAERWAHHGTWQEREALDRLQVLAIRADDFNESVDGNKNLPAVTEEEAFALREAFLRARSTFSDLHAVSSVEDDFRQIEILMEELAHYYGL